MENQQAIAVLERLKTVLRLDSDRELSERLGLAYHAFNKRKLRGSLPRDEIDTLIEVHGLNPAWVYSGQDPIYVGGDAQAQREQDLQELVAQMNAMSLHNETKRIMQPLLKSLVWGNSVSVEKWFEDIGGLTANERLIISAYRNGGPEVRSAFDLIATQGARKKPVVQQTFHGSVGQVIDGNQTIHGHQTIGVPPSKKIKP